LDFAGRVQLRRAFGYPGRIDAYERVWLWLSGIRPRTSIRLNQQLLPAPDPSTAETEYEVTHLLRPRNELLVDLDVGPNLPEVSFEAALEVRCTAFLRNLRRIAILISEGVELRIQGQVVGEAERPLELYVLLESAFLRYQVITATTEGSPFEIRVPNLSAEQWRSVDGQLLSLAVQVDLVNGAVVWFSNTEQVIPETDPVEEN
jgi:hypothetical protein